VIVVSILCFSGMLHFASPFMQLTRLTRSQIALRVDFIQAYSALDTLPPTIDITIEESLVVGLVDFGKGQRY